MASIHFGQSAVRNFPKLRSSVSRPSGMPMDRVMFRAADNTDNFVSELNLSAETREKLADLSGYEEPPEAVIRRGMDYLALKKQLEEKFGEEIHFAIYVERKGVLRPTSTPGWYTFKTPWIDRLLGRKRSHKIIAPVPFQSVVVPEGADSSKAAATALATDAINLLYEVRNVNQEHFSDAGVFTNVIEQGYGFCKDNLELVHRVE